MTNGKKPLRPLPAPKPKVQGSRLCDCGRVISANAPGCRACMDKAKEQLNAETAKGEA